jgi:ATP-binding cassette subfamily B protein
MLLIRRTFLAADAKEGELSTVMQENFTGVRVVRAFGREKFELEKFKKFNKEFKNLNYISLEYIAKYWGGTDLLCFFQISLVVVVGSLMAYNNEISLGTLFVFTIYVNSLVWPLRQLGRILSQMGRMEVSLTRINEILHTPLEEGTKDSVKPDLRGDIVFDNVYFEYEPGVPVLKNMSFTVKQGEKIAVLGSTGSGKSSLMHLLLRLYDYKKGSIKINGTELRDIDKKYLREHIGIVLQEPFLYSKTIMENIKMAKDNLSDEEVYEAAKAASVHDVIMGFKQQYNTVVGERGVTVSGGQKQRIAIARTLVKDSDILIFDDSLSAVDTETDMKIQAELKENNKGITTFIISQRITTLMDADRIFVMENGQLADSGSHAELISRDGLYYRVWNIQNTLEEEFESEELING